MSSYVYSKEINKNTAFYDYMIGLFPDTFVSHNSLSSTEVEVFFNRVLSTEEQTTVASAVSSYVEPSYYLVLHHTESSLMYSEFTDTNQYITVQSFIQSPDILSNNWSKGDVNAYLGSMKTILEICLDDAAVLQNWSSENPVTFDIQLFNKTLNNIITTKNVDITDILTSWKNTTPPLTGLITDWKSAQIFDLYNILPNYDCIWQIKTKLNNGITGLKIRLNSLQKIYYTLD